MGRHFEAIFNYLQDEETEAALHGALGESTLQGFVPPKMRDKLRGFDGMPSGTFKHAMPLLHVWLTWFS